MKMLGLLIGLLFLSVFGISIGGLLWEIGQIPVWLISLFLLPAGLFLDYFVKDEIYQTRIMKYSTTLGVLCMTLSGYLLLDLMGLPIWIVSAMVIFIFALSVIPLWFYLLPIWVPF